MLKKKTQTPGTISKVHPNNFIIINSICMDSEQCVHLLQCKIEN